MTKRIKLRKEDLLQELKDVNGHIKLLLNEITQNKKTSLVKPLSVELRKLYSPTKGNNLLRRIEEVFQIKISFPDRGKKLPPTTVRVELDEYRNNLIFALQGRKFTRLRLINLVAGQKGAHTDDSVDKIHFQSERIMLPLGNLARGGVLLEQNTRYLVTIAMTTRRVINDQILSILIN